MTGFNKNYYPRRPVKSFQDLEVYQKLLAVSVAVAKRIPLPNDVIHRCVLNLPLLIAETHSIRFSAPQAAIEKLEQVMLGCNQAVVYLEQYRDIENSRRPASQPNLPDVDGKTPADVIKNTIEPEFFEEQIKSLLITRTKVMHLQMSWKKFLAIKQKEQNV